MKLSHIKLYPLAIPLIEPIKMSGETITHANTLFAFFTAPIWAQGNDNYPSRPIKLIITWPVGGFADTLGRTIATQLGQILGRFTVHGWINCM